MALLGSLIWDSIAAALLLFVIALLYNTSQFGFFKKRGIPYVRPLPFVGNFGRCILGLCPIGASVNPMYQELRKHRYGGIFMSSTPALMVCDPELIKLVLTKDFSSLHDHGVQCDEVNDPLSVNLFNISGARWKNMRAKLSPVFTSGKLKQMLPLMSDVSEELADVLREKVAKGDNVELQDILTRYSVDVIGTCAFGISCHSLRNPSSEFYRQAKMFVRPSLLLTLRFSAITNSKLLSKIFPFKTLFPNMHEFFINLMSETIKYRKTNNFERNDFVQQLMQLQKNDEGKTTDTNPDEVLFTDSVISAQAFFFFIAGLDAIASTVGFALHHMCLDTRIQDDLADEVVSVINHHDGKITYEGLKQMKLLEMVVSECLRMYTPAGFLTREVTVSSYTLPDENEHCTFPKGTKIVIPVYGLHHDPDIYPDPHKFDPYRFTEEAISKRHPFTYLPFGEGPRVCIANRFALLEIKLCLAALIKDFKFGVCEQTQLKIKVKPYTFSVAPDKGFNFKIENRSF